MRIDQGDDGGGGHHQGPDRYGVVPEPHHARPYSAATGTEGASGFGRPRVDALLDHMAKMADQALHRPGGGVAQRADGVAFDLMADIEQHIDLALLGLALGHALEHPPHPARALAAGRALAARLMLVEIGEPRDGADDVGRLVHDDHRRGTEARLQRLEAVEIHREIVALARRECREPTSRRG